MADYPRMSSPWVEVGFDTWRYDIVLGDAELHLDLAELARYTGADVPPPSTTTTTEAPASTATTSPVSSAPPVAPDPDPEPQAAEVARPVPGRPRFTG